MGNQLRTLDKEVFEPLANLEVLLLDSNQLEDINGKVDHEVDNQDIKRDFKNSKTLRLFVSRSLDLDIPLKFHQNQM